jgi:glycerate 2-kinase
VTSQREMIQEIYRSAVAAVDPRAAVRQALESRIDGNELCGVDLASNPLHVLAIGKASETMALGAVDALGAHVRGGIAVGKGPGGEQLLGIRYIQGSHPVPDNRSLDAGEAVLEYARQLPEDATVLCLISGGGSALVEALMPDITLDDLQAVTKALLEGGAPIEELNAVRSRLSRIKGGGLLQLLGGNRVVNLIVSDVLGDNFQVIASGPTVAPHTETPAEEILSDYGLDVSLSPVASEEWRSPMCTQIIANLPLAIEAAAERAGELGLRPVVLTSQLEGEASEVGRVLARILKGWKDQRSPLSKGDCVIAGGETTVTVRGSGVGGRNTECALAMAIELSSVEHLTVGCLATDGDDGETASAGAIVDGATISADGLRRAREALEENDSYGYLSETGATWAPGATGTNVNDLLIAIIE